MCYACIVYYRNDIYCKDCVLYVVDIFDDIKQAFKEVFGGKQK